MRQKTFVAAAALGLFPLAARLHRFLGAPSWLALPEGRS